MNIPTIFDWVERLDFMRGLPAAYGVFIAAAVVVVVWDWRLALFALATTYFCASLLFVDILDPRLAVIKLLVGMFICLMLYFTARQVDWGRLPPDLTPEEAASLEAARRVSLGPLSVTVGLPFRAILVLLMAVVVWIISANSEYQLPGVSNDALTLAIYALGGMGLLGVSLTTEPLKAGMGVLLFVTGFELYYNGLEQSVALLAFMALANLSIALTISYLTQARHAFTAVLE